MTPMPDINEPTEVEIEAAAWALCKATGCEPDALEPGDFPRIDGYNRKGEPCHFLWRDFVDKAKITLLAARRVSSAPSFADVQVKPLEWGEEIIGSEFRGGCTAYAASSFGVYQVWGDGLWFDPIRKSVIRNSNIDEAKAAAQADYEQRIRSAIDSVPVPSFADGIEAAAKYAAKLRDDSRLEPMEFSEIAKGIRALAHNPQASSGGDEGKWLGPYKTAAEALDDCRKAVATEIGADPETWPDHGNAALAIAATVALARIRYRSAAAEGNEAEAPAPKPDPAIAELVEQIIAGNGPMGKWVGSIDYSTYEGFEKYLEVQLREALHLKASLDKKRDNDAESESLATFVDGKSGAIEEALATFRTVRARETAALTASNDRVAELERENFVLAANQCDGPKRGDEHGHEYCPIVEALKRERDAAFKLAHGWAARAGSADVRAVTLEAEVSRLKAGAVTDWQLIESVPKDGRSIAVWLPATATEQPHAFAPVSICEDGTWWDDSTGDQIEPLAATYWAPIHAPSALSNQAGASK